MDFSKIDSQNKAEIEEIVDLLSNSFPCNRNWIEEQIEIILSDSNDSGDLFRLTSETEKLIATVTYGQIFRDGWNGETFVRFLAVSPQYRQQGYATWIVEKIKQDAKENGSNSVQCSSYKSDEIANRLWQKCSFSTYPHAEEEDSCWHVYWIEKQC